MLRAIDVSDIAGIGGFVLIGWASTRIWSVDVATLVIGALLLGVATIGQITGAVHRRHD